MACSSEDLTCSICLALFTDPVTLPCGHSFCRDCIHVSLHNTRHCPHCRSPVDTGFMSTASSNHVLKSLVEKAKEKLLYRQDKEKAEFLCSEHDEKLKLFCITDQQLICVICINAQKHESHKFKPVSEAAALVKNELQSLVRRVNEDTQALETKASSQKQEINETKRRSEELKTLIRSQFQEMHTFLQEKEKQLNEKVKHDEEEALQKMTTTLHDIEATKAENQQLEETVTTVININDTEHFLKMWSEQGKAKAIKASFKPKNANFQVQKKKLSLGPYESHLQMFVWKEMLQVVKRREERLSLRVDKTSLSVSPDQSVALFCQTQCGGTLDYYGQRTTLPKSTESTNTFTAQHYWEVYVGAQSEWGLGLPQTYLKYSSGKFQIFTSGRSEALSIRDKPQKIGIYLNCPRKELEFYNADTMRHMHTASLASTTFPVSAFFSLGPTQTRHCPLVVYRY